jgi:hypothetical protein
MKVLVSRSCSLLFSRLTVLADQFSWSVRTLSSILNKLLEYLNYRSVYKYTYVGDNTERSISTYLTTLPPEKLRRLIRLSEIICNAPDMFDRLFECFLSIPLYRMLDILCLDRQFLKSSFFVSYSQSITV